MAEIRKHAYKLSAFIIAHASALLDGEWPHEDIKIIKRARRQAGKVYCAIVSGDSEVRATLAKYEPDLTDFLEDYPG